MAGLGAEAAIVPMPPEYAFWHGRLNGNVESNECIENILQHPLSRAPVGCGAYVEPLVFDGFE